MRTHASASLPAILAALTALAATLPAPVFAAPCTSDYINMLLHSHERSTLKIAIAESRPADARQRGRRRADAAAAAGQTQRRIQDPAPLQAAARALRRDHRLGEHGRQRAA